MSERSDRLIKLINNTKMTISTNKARLFMEGYQKYEGDVDIIRTAKAQAYMLENIPIYILDDDLIAGASSSALLALEADFWTRGFWKPEGIEAIRNDASITVSDETAQEMYRLSDYFKKYSVEHKTYEYFNDKMWNWMQSGFYIPVNRNIDEAAGNGFAISSLSIYAEEGSIFSLNYGHIIHTGLRAKIDECKKELSEMDFFKIRKPEDMNRIYALQAMIIIDEGIIKWANRYADLAEQLMENCTDSRRRQELRYMADACRRVPEFPCITFREAIHSQWLLYCVTCYFNTTSVGRADQFFYPCYKHDIENGLIDRETAIEYLECFRLKYFEIRSTSGGGHRSKWSGNAAWRNVTIGGVDENGNDATNELTYLFIEAAKRCQVPHHTLSLRVHENTPDDLMLKAVELTKTGIGMPSYIGDKSYIQTLLDKDVPLKEARGFQITGCVDLMLPESWSKLFAFTVTALPFDAFMHNGYSPMQKMQIGPETGDPRTMKTFDEFFNAMLGQYRYFFEGYAAYDAMRCLARKTQRLFEDASIVSMHSDGPHVGLGPFDRGAKYPKLSATIGVGCGTINIGDSLAVIKKLVYDEKKLSMDELISALDSNWEGPRNQEIRKMCLDVPKYGNNNKETDETVGRFYGAIADIVNSLTDYRGAKYSASALSITSHEPGGKVVGATPDGRYAGTVLADGSGSPVQGSDKSGPTAVFMSALNIPQNKLNALLLNMKMHPSALQTEEDMKKFAAMIKIYFANGGKQVQFNVVSQEKLEEAKREPEKNEDLIVRVAGYSAYFTRLSPTIQDEIIARSSHTL